MKAFIIGCTGLVGRQIMKQARTTNEIEKVVTVSRRKVEEDAKAESLVESDLQKWPETIKKHANGISVLFSAFGTTRSAAGGIENFRNIDYGTNFECARAAREAGVDTIVLISTLGASEGSYVPYLSIKGKLENDIIALKFPRTIILRPGVLLGEREKLKGLMTDFMVAIGNASYGTMFQFLTHPAKADALGKIATYLALQPKSTNAGSEEVLILKKNELLELAQKL